jgi:hypothetical protein
MLSSCNEGIHFSSGQSPCNKLIGLAGVGFSHWVSPSKVELTAELGLASPVLQPTRTPWLSFFYQLPIFLLFLGLGRLYLPLLTAVAFIPVKPSSF